MASTCSFKIKASPWPLPCPAPKRYMASALRLSCWVWWIMSSSLDPMRSKSANKRYAEGWSDGWGNSLHGMGKSKCDIVPAEQGDEMNSITRGFFFNQYPMALSWNLPVLVYAYSVMSGHFFCILLFICGTPVRWRHWSPRRSRSVAVRVSWNMKSSHNQPRVLCLEMLMMLDLEVWQEEFGRAGADISDAWQELLQFW